MILIGYGYGYSQIRITQHSQPISGRDFLLLALLIGLLVHDICGILVQAGFNSESFYSRSSAKPCLSGASTGCLDAVGEFFHLLATCHSGANMQYLRIPPEP